MYKNRIPDDQLDWVFDALKQIHTDLVLYRNDLLQK